MPVTPSAATLHIAFAALMVVCYTILTAVGHDGNALLALLGGQGVGAGIQAATGGTPNG